MGAFRRQFTALFVKNWIVLSKNPFLNVLRCLLAPIAFAVFLAYAKNFLSRPNNYGLGTPAPIKNLTDQIDGSLKLIWADATDGTGSPSAADIMNFVTASFSDRQRAAVQQVPVANITTYCPQNFNLLSECFGAVNFTHLTSAARTDTSDIQYTIRSDGGLFYVNVDKHNGDFQERVLPLQWAVDSAIIELKTGRKPPTPLEWPFTDETNEQQATMFRISYVQGLRSLLVLGLFVAFVGIAYQLPGNFAAERSSQVTAHMKAMGLGNLARISSWHISLSLAYLPAWIIVGLIWHYTIYTETSVWLILAIHLLFALSLTSWSIFVAAFFGSSPQLAAVVTTFLSILIAILSLVYWYAGTAGATIFTLVLPPAFYIFALRSISGFEIALLPANAVKPDPDYQLLLLPMLIVAIINIFLWPAIAVLVENILYDAMQPSKDMFSKKVQEEPHEPLPDDVEISVRGLGKTFSTSIWRTKKSQVTAIDSLTFDVPKKGIFVLLGSNGAGKSTCLSILGNLIGRTSGTVRFAGDVDRPRKGTLGIVPQKNVLFPELSCYQTLRVWKAVKRLDDTDPDEDIEQLLIDCDLKKKIHANSNTLSGGQKRKLQLAIGLIGGSKIVLVDECTSGVDPLSRRALWKTLTAVKHDRTIIFTTHFLDEADLLADNIAILAAPGKLVAAGSPVKLKSSMGRGYRIHVIPVGEAPFTVDAKSKVLDVVQSQAPAAFDTSASSHHAEFQLASKDQAVVQRVLEALDGQKEKLGIASYDIVGSTVEDIFLHLMEEEANKDISATSSTIDSDKDKAIADASAPTGSTALPIIPSAVTLSDGRETTVLKQALVIFYKRWLVARRSWMTPLLAILIGVLGACVPVFYLIGRPVACGTRFRNTTSTSLYLPSSVISMQDPTAAASVQEFPPDIIETLGGATRLFRTTNINDNATFVDTIKNNIHELSIGGLSIDTSSSQSLFAYESTEPGINGPALLNLASNVLYNSALNATGGQGGAGTQSHLIQTSYGTFPPVSSGTLVALKWIAFFGAAMSVTPAFFTLYVSAERRSDVQAMQRSNGLSNTLGLWLGHLMFDSLLFTFVATVIIIVFAVSQSSQFAGLGFFWLVLVLYGFAATLFAYFTTIITASPLAAFATYAGYQIILFILYLAANLLTLTYAKFSQQSRFMTIIHFTMALLSPIISLIRSALVSSNLFSLLCDGATKVGSRGQGSLNRYGGAILYLVIYSFVLMAILVLWDSGALYVRKRKAASQSELVEEKVAKPDVLAEESSVETSGDLLRVLHVTKTYHPNTVVDDVSLGVSRDTIFALLGPNSAGKTTLFSIIRGDLVPNAGDVLIGGVSVVRNPRTARLSLGVCPQFTAIDSQLSVRDHLHVYGRLKGLKRGEELNDNITAVMEATALSPYADRLASKLSGGNQRKLSLAIALIGNPPVILIDEFSTGIDAKVKRDMWATLRRVAVGKAVIITTHSMEEASALASKVGIIAKRILAVGPTEDLSSRYPMYEVHFTCRNREEVSRAQTLMADIPGAKLADDVATRFEIPIDSAFTLPQLFKFLAEKSEFEYTIEKANLESIFLKVIRENDVVEEDSTHRHVPWYRRWC